MIKRSGYREVDLTTSTIETSEVQARQENVDANIDELVQSIELQGLFSPVLLIDLGDSKYELIAGQRRTKAYRKLAEKDPEKFKKIPAFIYENNMENWEKKAISINENFNQEPMSEADKISAVTACYNQFDNMTITSQKTGISINKVSKYVKYERLPQILKKLKDEGKITLRTAIETANLFGFNNSDIGDVPEKEIEIAALANEKLTSKQKKQLQKAKKEEPDESIPNLTKRIQDTKQQTRLINIQVTSDTYSRVSHYASDVIKKSVDLAAEELIEEGLESKNL